MFDLKIQNCKIVNENTVTEADIAIKNSRIELIEKEITAEAKEVVDAKGRYVIPGLIDDQVHFREPGLTHKGDIATESRAGLAGGVTSYFEMPNVNPTTTTNENLTKKFQLASTKSLSNYSFHLGASNTNIEEIKRADIHQASALKVLYMAISPKCHKTLRERARSRLGNWHRCSQVQLANRLSGLVGSRLNPPKPVG